MHKDASSEGQIISDNAAFWEDYYQHKRTQSNGKPSAALVRFTTDLPPGRALELGCSHGDDALWLAMRGWKVVAVDISAIALERALAKAVAAGLDHRIDFRCLDLLESFPEEHFDLVTAFFLQSPVQIPRARILRQAAGAVAPGGLFLMVDHGAMPPSAEMEHPHPEFPTLEETHSQLNAHASHWETVYLDSPQREVELPDGKKVSLKDNIIALRRKRSE